MILIPDQKPNTSHHYSYCLSNSFLLEDIDVEIGSMWIHLTLFDQKLLKKLELNTAGSHGKAVTTTCKLCMLNSKTRRSEVHKFFTLWISCLFGSTDSRRPAFSILNWRGAG